jgi:hypothetical protein
MPLLKKGFYARILLMKRNDTYSLLLKAGGSVIYRVFNGEAFDLHD